MRACSDASVLPSATVGWSFEMVAQKAGGVLDGTWGWQRGCRSSGKEAWKHRGIVASWPAADPTQAPRTCQQLAREDWLPFQESHSQRTRPSPFHGSRYTLSVSTGRLYGRNARPPARSFRAAPAPSSTCTHASCSWSASNARALHHQPLVSNGCIALQTHVSQSRHPCRSKHPGWAISLPHNQCPAAA